jgi:hypothetical protein
MIGACEIIASSLGALFQCERVNEFVRIRTPFMYPDGDNIDLYLKESGAGLTVTDLGEALQWLWTHQVGQKRTNRQEQIVQEVAARAGVELFRETLIVRLRDPQGMAQAVTNLSQAVLRVADIWFTFRVRSPESIAIEVAELLTQEHIAFEQGKRISGRSGQQWRIDFQTRTKDRSALVKILSTGSRAAAKQITDSAVACWFDLSHFKTSGGDLSFVSLLDDTSDVWTVEDIARVQELSEVSYWSRPDEFAEKLAA